MIKARGWFHGGSVSSTSFVAPAVPRAAPAQASAAAHDDRMRALHAAYCDFAWRSLRRLGLTDDEADDAVQQVFLVLSRRAADIAPDRERSFVFGVVVRTASDVRRARVRRAEVSEEIEIEDLAPGPDALLDRHRARALLDRVLEQMPWDLRTVFVLFELEEMTMAEIADVLALRPGTVASRLRRAREDFEARIARVQASRARAGGAP